MTLHFRKLSKPLPSFISHTTTVLGEEYVDHQGRIFEKITKVDTAAPAHVGVLWYVLDLDPNPGQGMSERLPAHLIERVHSCQVPYTFEKDSVGLITNILPVTVEKVEPKKETAVLSTKRCDSSKYPSVSGPYSTVSDPIAPLMKQLRHQVLSKGVWPHCANDYYVEHQIEQAHKIPGMVTLTLKCPACK